MNYSNDFIAAAAYKSNKIIIAQIANPAFSLVERIQTIIIPHNTNVKGDHARHTSFIEFFLRSITHNIIK